MAGSDGDGKGGQIENPSDSDVLCGRGGSINAHPGNERFRELVEKRKRVYLTARFKREKRLIASSIVSEIRALDPPGRFLSKDSKTGKWVDIGDEKARDKTSQALRENAPSIRAEIETEINEHRAEIQRVESEQVVHPPNPDQHHQPYFGGQPWGYFSYYGYAQHSPHGSMPPPPPVPPQGAVSSLPYPQYPHAPPPGYTNEPPPGYTGPWGETPPSASPPSSSGAQPPPSSQRHFFNSDNSTSNEPVPDDQKSTFEQTVEQTADLVSSVPSTFKNWSKTSFSFGAPNSHDEAEENASIQSKPIVYIHDANSTDRNKPIVYMHNSEADRTGRPRLVHFQDDRNPTGISHPNRRRENLPPRSGVMRGSGIQLKPNRYSKRKPPLKHNLPRDNQQQQYHYHNDSNYSNGSGGYNHDARERISYSPINQVNQDGEECKMSIVEEIVEEDPVMSFIDEDAPLDDEQESTPNGPQPAEDQTAVSSSFFTQMANSVFGSVGASIGSRGQSIGSFDTSFMNDAGSVAGSLAESMTSFLGGQSNNGGSVSRQRVTKRRNSLGSFSAGASLMSQNFDAQSAVSRDETMAVEIEGQEVELFDKHPGASGSSIVADERRIMPPPKQKFEIDWPSRVGSCHSWIPEMSGAASFFSSKGSNVSPVGSMEMDSCGGSLGGSIGGGSLCKVFEPERPGMASPRGSIGGNSGRGGLTQMPSWERNFRCRSPSSIASDNDDASLISKSSGKSGTLDSSNYTDSTQGRMASGDEMNWESHNKK